MPIAWPEDCIPNRVNFYLQHNTTVFASPITRSRQVLRRQGERWRGDFGFRLPKDKARIFDAFLAKLKGAYETAYVRDFDREQPSGANLQSGDVSGDTYFLDIGPPTQTEFTDGTHFAGGIGVRVNGTNVIGSATLSTVGWAQSTVGQLKAGDYVEAGGFLYMLTDDADSDASGVAALNIAPRLQSALADSATITLVRASSVMHLVDDDQPQRSVGNEHVYEYSLSFVQEL